MKKQKTIFKLGTTLLAASAIGAFTTLPLVSCGQKDDSNVVTSIRVFKNKTTYDINNSVDILGTNHSTLELNVKAYNSLGVELPISKMQCYVGEGDQGLIGFTVKNNIITINCLEDINDDDIKIVDFNVTIDNVNKTFQIRGVSDTHVSEIKLFDTEDNEINNIILNINDSDGQDFTAKVYNAAGSEIKSNTLPIEYEINAYSKKNIIVSNVNMISTFKPTEGSLGSFNQVTVACGNSQQKTINVVCVENESSLTYTIGNQSYTENIPLNNTNKVAFSSMSNNRLTFNNGEQDFEIPSNDIRSIVFGQDWLEMKALDDYFLSYAFDGIKNSEIYIDMAGLANVETVGENFCSKMFANSSNIGINNNFNLPQNIIKVGKYFCFEMFDTAKKITYTTYISSEATKGVKITFKFTASMALINADADDYDLTDLNGKAIDKKTDIPANSILIIKNEKTSN